MKNVMKKDLVIIGGGPAGLTASLYASRSLLDTITLEQEAVGGQVILTNEVDNYPAVPHVDGYTLAEAMRTQAEELGGSIVMESALSITTDPETGTFHVTSSDVEYVSRAVILAGGATPRRAGFDGEERFAGHGVSYCATCDGMNEFAYDGYGPLNGPPPWKWAARYEYESSTTPLVGFAAWITWPPPT